MTAEVAILNADAVVLAADSAVTVGTFDGIKAFPRASKIFALSEVHPVAVMFYGDARFMGVPWETLIKEYRAAHGDEARPRVSDHASAFLRWIADTRERFARGASEQGLEAVIEANTQGFIKALKERLGARRPSAESVRAAASEVLKSERSRLSTCDDGADVEWRAIAREYEPALRRGVDAVLEKVPLTNAQREDLYAIVGARIFSADAFARGGSGLVVAGFGAEQWLPAAEHRKVGLLLPSGVLQSGRVESHEIGPEADAVIMPVANATEILAFIDGIHPRFRSEVVAHGPARGADRKKFERFLERTSRDEFANKITDMTARMPRDELAVMAETLVNLCAFRQRLSGQLETVSGPVDVAVISRGDGLVWVKRKHYFPAELNPQYFQRRTSSRKSP